MVRCLKNMSSQKNGWIFTANPTKPLVSTKQADLVQVCTVEPMVTEKKGSNFQSAIKNIVIIGQFFGLNPVQGVRDKDPAKLRFKYLSWRCALTFLCMLGQFVMSFLRLLSFFISKRTSFMNCATDLMFYMLALLITLKFLRIATKWPELCMQISIMEAKYDPNMDWKLRKKLNISCLAVLGLAFIEHFLSILHDIDLAMGCEPDVPVFEGFITQSIPWVYLIVPHNRWFGLAVFHFIRVQCTLDLNFTDLFIICMSIYLTSRLEQINQKVLAAKDKNGPPSFWCTLREEYNNVTRLVRQVDAIIGGLIFLSFAGNVLFICAQLLHTLTEGVNVSVKCKDDSNPTGSHSLDLVHPIYFTYSFIYLLGRSLAVSLTASKVHAASVEPVYTLYSVSSNYGVEVQRFIEQIHGNTVALSGMKFFFVKRGLILTIAGTIITYELVLMQFAKETPSTPAN